MQQRNFYVVGNGDSWMVTSPIYIYGLNAIGKNSYESKLLFSEPFIKPLKDPSVWMNSVIPFSSSTNIEWTMSPNIAQLSVEMKSQVSCSPEK